MYISAEQQVRHELLTWREGQSLVEVLVALDDGVSDEENFRSNYTGVILGYCKNRALHDRNETSAAPITKWCSLHDINRVKVWIRRHCLPAIAMDLNPEHVHLCFCPSNCFL